MRIAGYGKSNKQLVSVFVNNIDDELTYLSHLIKMKPSYLGAIVANPKSLLNKIRKESRFSRIYAEVLSVQKKRLYTEVLTNEGIIHCKRSYSALVASGRGCLRSLLMRRWEVISLRLQKILGVR